jgi:tRNA (guanine37-N1)-methyltransferase
VRIDMLTIFPGFFRGPLDASLLGRARQRGLVDVRVHDLRRWTDDVHRTVDDAPFGGGAGMVMKPEPFFRAVEELYGSIDARPRTVLLTPRGRPFTQQTAVAFSSADLLLLCGRYEGIDERVHTALATDEVSIGDYVLAGGEVAACVVIEAVTRLVPGVMGNVVSTDEESFSGGGLLEYPHYTRPAVYRGMPVPEVLRSGDHGRVAAWRHEQSVARTRAVRPELLDRPWSPAEPDEPPP